MSCRIVGIPPAQRCDSKRGFDLACHHCAAYPDRSGPAAPTGQVFNAFASSGAFTLQDGSIATFLFATEDGTISGWNAAAGSQSIIAVNEAAGPADASEALGLGAVYKGAGAGNGFVDEFDL
jgi:hypothetical protein